MYFIRSALEKDVLPDVLYAYLFCSIQGFLSSMAIQDLSNLEIKYFFMIRVCFIVSIIQISVRYI